MLQPGMRRLTALAAAAAMSCGGDDGADEVGRYLRDGAWRRAEMVASLTTRDNDYARLRLARYESGAADDWARLPAWNPPAARVTRDAPTPTPEAPLDVPAAAAGGDRAALRSVGERAFWRYPAMLASPAAEATLREPGAAERYGFWTAPDGALGGLVRVALADGSVGLAYACATCHATVGRDGSVVAGLANASLDLGALGADGNPTLTASQEARLRAWGRGRVDVTTDDGTEPVATPDLRAVREQAFLQRAGAVRRRSLTALAIRVETLLITSHHGVVRPPREVAMGLALFLEGLGDSLAEDAAGGGRGAGLFATTCAGCHAPPTYGGGLVAAEAVGTDATIARTATRGTGSYRVPSLRGVGARRWLLHDGAVDGVDGLLDPARLRDDYAGPRGRGAVRGHGYGLDLGEGDRAALREYVRGL